MVTGGRWADGAAVGIYRVLLTPEPTRVAGYKQPVSRLRAYVQWVEVDGQGRPVAVRATAAVPADSRVDVQWGPELAERDGEWRLRLRGTRRRLLNDLSPTSLMFVLGPPGVVRAAPR
jgi:hypothetical protein